MTALDPAPRNPALAPPPRRPGSVRRTSTILMSWPGGLGSSLRLDGRCRDLLTPRVGVPTVLGEAGLEAFASLDRTIEQVASTPEVPALAGLVGVRGGGNLRAALDRVVPEQRAGATPLHLLLDDLAGTTLIAGFVWFRWRDAVPEVAERFGRMPPRSMQGICSGFRPGSSALSPDGMLSGISQNVAVVPPLADPRDPDGWHELDPHPPIAMRRARRIDTWLDGDRIEVDAMFRDSAWDPDGTEIAVHEYAVLATADRATGRLVSVIAEPRVLPFAECPGAAPNAAWLVGVEVRELRTEVLARLRSTDCCTHLNDALRSLAEVPALAGALGE
jgi:hypothetical protein